MVSQRKSETARANGAKSRGPITLAGKQAYSHNALKHGLTADNGNILLDCEDPAQFDEAARKLLDIHKPLTPAEQDMVEEMNAARWRIRRVWTIETDLLNAVIVTRKSKSELAHPNAHLASAFRSLADDSRSLALASRYEARLQRLYDRAYKTLRELQQAREAAEPEQPREIRVRWVDNPEDPDPAHGKTLRNEPTADANKDVAPPNTLRSWKFILPAMAAAFYDKLKAMRALWAVVGAAVAIVALAQPRPEPRAISIHPSPASAESSLSASSAAAVSPKEGCELRCAMIRSICSAE